jgi:putative hydrolase of the HAD superfamily
MPIVFDLFGVIALPQTPEARRRIEEVAGVDPAAFWAAYWGLRKPYDAGQPSADYWAAVAGRLGVRFTGEKVRALVAADLASWVDVDAAMVDLVGELAADGRVLGLLSNIIGDLVPVFEKQHGRWLGHFAARTYSCDIGVAKPDRRAYEIAADRLGAEPGDCLFVDDSEANVLAAREAGMRAEVFRSRDQVRELVRRSSRSTGERSGR